MPAELSGENLGERVDLFVACRRVDDEDAFAVALVDRLGPPNTLFDSESRTSPITTFFETAQIEMIALEPPTPRSHRLRFNSLAMYPILFRIGDFEVTTFGALVALGALTGLWIFHRELVRSGLPATGVDAALMGVLGGLAGAKIVWAIEFRHQAPFLSLLFSRGGLSWFGGFVGGVGAGLWALRRRRIPIVAALAAASPALAIGHAIGRIGCFLVGDDYGRPTDLPWGIAFPKGLPPTTVPVHPTQLYEAAGLAAIAWLLIKWRRKSVADAIVFGRYLILAGALRFFIEFIRVNIRVAGPLTLAQIFSLAIMVVGLWFMRWRSTPIHGGRR